MARRRKTIRKSRKSLTKAELSRTRGHIPTNVLEGYLAAMPRHMHSLARLIKQRKASGE
jgi:hypothetical protein